MAGPPFYYRVIWKSRITGVQEFRNTFYYRSTSAGLFNQAQRIAVMEILTQQWPQVVTSNVTLYGITWEYQDDAGTWQPLAEDGYNVVGTRSTPTCPLTVAAVAIGKTAKRRTFGRKFLGPIAIADQSHGVLVVATQNALLEFAHRWSIEFLNGPTEAMPGVWSLEYGYTPLSGYKTSALLGSQHNRKIGQGV